MALAATDSARAYAVDRHRGRCVPLGRLGDRSARGPHRRRPLPDRLGVVSLALWASASRANRDAGGTGGGRGVVVFGGGPARGGADGMGPAGAPVVSRGPAAIFRRPL